MAKTRQRPRWTQLSEATREEHLAHEEADRAFAAELPERVRAHLEGLRARGIDSALPVDRLTHCLQTATRAFRDERDDGRMTASEVRGLSET